MTICIAALYDKGAGAVLVSDKMVTARIPMGYEFEHDETTKIIGLDGDGSVYALISGDVMRGNEILNVAKAQIAQNNGNVTASQAAELVRAAYQQVRLANVIHRELEPRGLDLQNYYSVQQQLSPQVVQIIDQALANADLGVEMLVAGRNGETCTIHTIMNPGLVHDNTSIGHGERWTPIVGQVGSYFKVVSAVHHMLPD